MTVLFDGDLYTSYHQAYIVSGDAEIPMPDMATAGQRNGLCGAQLPGTLFLTTGSEAGDIRFRVVLLDAAPTDLDGWDDVVEVSFRPTADPVALVAWAGEMSHDLALPIQPYRVQYCGRGLDEGASYWVEDGPQADVYELRFWSDDAVRNDVVLRETSAAATYWHSAARGRAADG